jgi:hypothetical protein
MPPFDPATIPLFTAIHLLLEIDGDPVPVRKWLIVIAHIPGAAVCLKTTSNTGPYESDPEKMAGAVYYKAGELTCFPKNTAIQPDNRFTVSHDKIKADRELKTFAMPADFKERLKKAVAESVTLWGAKRKTIEAILA